MAHRAPEAFPRGLKLFLMLAKQCSSILQTLSLHCQPSHVQFRETQLLVTSIDLGLRPSLGGTVVSHRRQRQTPLEPLPREHPIQAIPATLDAMSFFRITLIRSPIGLPRAYTGVLKALGLRKRMATVFHPVTPSIAGQIMRVKELVAVCEVEQRETKAEVHAKRVPEKGWYIETPANSSAEMEAQR